MRACRILALVLLSVGGCAGTVRLELMKPIPATCPPSADFRVTTYNMAQAPGVNRLVNERLAPAAAAIRRELERSDLVCVQEAWTDQARQAVIQQSGLPPENYYWVDTKGVGETGLDRCDARQLTGILDCVRKNCRNVPGQDTSICARQKCLWKLVWLYLSGSRCLNCLTATIGHPMGRVIDTCVDGLGASRAFGGSNGIIMLSRRPLRNREVVHLPASGSNRVALLATVEIAPGRSVEVACTHMTTHLDQAPTSGFRSWRLEQAAQFVRVSRRLRGRAGHRPQLLIGDLNFGQRHDPVNTVMWPSWKMATDAGFISPAEYAKPPVYSFCSGSCRSPDSSKVLIDHVLIRQSARHWGLRAVCAERVFERPVRIVDRRGRRRSVMMSDHLGVSVAFKIRGPIARPRQP